MSFIRANALSPDGSPYGSMLLLGHIGKALFIGRVCEKACKPNIWLAPSTMPHRITKHDARRSRFIHERLTTQNV